MSSDDSTPKGPQHPREIAPHILEELLDLRVAKRQRWPELTAYYNELTGESIREETLRRALRGDAPIRSISAQANCEIRSTISQIWEAADADHPILDAVYAEYVEWRLVNNQLRSAGLQGAGEEISQETIQHVDRLKNDLARLFFELAASTEDLSEPGALLGRLTTDLGPVNERDGSSSPRTVEELQDYFGDMFAQQESKLKEIHAKHRREARGIYRPIREEPDDFLDDEFFEEL